eukprot:1161679-Pelagomonas_calceolata.AAC.4
MFLGAQNGPRMELGASLDDEARRLEKKHGKEHVQQCRPVGSICWGTNLDPMKVFYSCATNLLKAATLPLGSPGLHAALSSRPDATRIGIIGAPQCQLPISENKNLASLSKLKPGTAAQ